MIDMRRGAELSAILLKVRVKLNDSTVSKTHEKPFCEMKGKKAEYNKESDGRSPGWEVKKLICKKKKKNQFAIPLITILWPLPGHFRCGL